MTRFLAGLALFIGLAGLVFPYLGYLFLLEIRSLKKRVKPDQLAARPTVSVTVAAYNEASAIRGKIENLREQDYPSIREIIIVSDASDDGTDGIVEAMGERDRRIRLIRQDERRGKSAAQNLACESATGEILVFTDASVLLAPGAISALVDELDDPTVGCVSGEDRSVAADESDHSAGAGFYTSFEIIIRRLEIERTGTLIGVSGCLFAVRRFLRPPIPVETVDDLYIPLHVVARGFRVVAAKNAVAYVRRTMGFRQEYHRKVRTFTGALFTYFAARRRENAHGLRRVRVHLLAHKMARWLGPLFAAMALAGAAFLAGTNALFLLLLIAQLAAYALAIYGVVAALQAERVSKGPGFINNARTFIREWRFIDCDKYMREKFGEEKPDNPALDASTENGSFADNAEDKHRPLPMPGGIIGKVIRIASFFLVVQTALAHAWMRFLLRRPFAAWAPTQRVGTT